MTKEDDVGFTVGGTESEREDAAVAALVLLHRQRLRAAHRPGRGSEYQRIVAHFERRGERLRGERLATEELVERLFRANERLGPRPVQRELEMHGPPGGSAAGRLRVTNSGPDARAFELTVGDAVSGTSAPEVRADPQRGTLGAGQSCWVRVEASLHGMAPGDSATVPIECRWDTGVGRIWLVVVADPREGSLT
jgi:hypothetical protein